MDIYAENNGGFQVLEGISPFEEGSQLQGEGYTEMPYQEPAAGPAWYGEAQGTEGLPAGAYQETVMQTAGGGNMYGAENFSTAPYQELPTESGAEIYMGETDVLPVAPGQMLFQETEAPVIYQTAVSSMGEGTLAQAGMPQMEGIVSDAGLETAEMQAVDPEASDQEMADSETADLGADEMETAETAGIEPRAAEAAPDADKEDDEETRRMKHETAEAERKAEWEEKQQAKKAAEQEKLDQLANMSDDAAVSAALKQVGAETEKLTRRNMKDCVAEYVQTLCLEDPGFARMVMYPRKNMIHCFHYINRKAKEFIQQGWRIMTSSRRTGYMEVMCRTICATSGRRNISVIRTRRRTGRKKKNLSPSLTWERAGSRQRPKRLQRKSLRQKSPQPQSRRIKKRKNQDRRLTARCPFPGRCRLMTLWCRR